VSFRTPHYSHHFASHCKLTSSKYCLVRLLVYHNAQDRHTPPKTSTCLQDCHSWSRRHSAQIRCSFHSAAQNLVDPLTAHLDDTDSQAACVLLYSCQSCSSASEAATGISHLVSADSYTAITACTSSLTTAIQSFCLHHDSK